MGKCNYQKRAFIIKILYWMLNSSYFLVGHDLVTPTGRRKKQQNERKLHVSIFF